MMLFKVNTHYQLMNAINVKLNIYPSEPADLILDDTTNFKGIVEKLQETGIFRKIYLMYAEKYISKYLSLNNMDKIKFVHNIEKYIPSILDNSVTYESYYIGLDNISNKLFYYYLIKKQKIAPSIYGLEEGTTTFVRDIKRELKGDMIPHNEFGEKCFFDNLVGIYLYNPELYAVIKPEYKVFSLPQMNDNTIQKLLSIYGYQKAPVEDYIYMEFGVLTGRAPTNDTEIVMFISEIIGKENIIIKLHPRSKVDRFSPLGFKVMENSGYPWELIAGTQDISKKCLISSLSTASFTGKTIFGKSQKSIHIFKLENTNDLLFTYPSFKRFYNKFLECMNKEKKLFYCPSNLDELKEILIYIAGIKKEKINDSI